jgi:hypothetical protein
MRFIIALVLVLLVVGAYFRGWFQFGVNDEPGKSATTASLTINNKKIQEDVSDLAQATKDKVGSLSKASAQSNGITESTTQGQVQKVAQGQLTVRTPDDQVMSFGVNPNTEIQIGDRPGTLADIKKDDPVSVRHAERDGRHQAISVIVETR